MIAGKMAVEIENIDTPEMLEEYLKDKPKELAQIIASRCALRVLPFLNSAFTSDYKDRFLLTQNVFRCNLISWAVRNYPAHDMTAYAVNAASNAAAYAAVDAVAYAVNAAAYAAANTATYAVNAANTADIWKSIQQDLTLFRDKGESGLISSALWQEDIPTAFQDNWMVLRKNLLDGNSDWQVWTDWYEHVLHGANSPKRGIAALSEEKLIKLAQKPNEFWEREPEEINAEIAGWVNADILISSTNSKLGSIWEAEEDQFKRIETSESEDHDVAEDVRTNKSHKLLLDKIHNLKDAALTIEEDYGWVDFTSAFNNLAGILDCETVVLAGEIETVYDYSVTFGSFLQMDINLRKNPSGNMTCLSANHRRLFEEVIRSVAPFVRRFPTARSIDEETGEFLGKLSKTLAEKLVNSAFERKIISDGDHKRILKLLAAMERNGLLAKKSEIRGYFSATNLVLAAVAFISGTFATGVIEKTQIYENSTDWVIENSGNILEAFEDAPADVRSIIEAMLEKLPDENNSDKDDIDIVLNEERRRRLGEDK